MEKETENDMVFFKPHSPALVAHAPTPTMLYLLILPSISAAGDLEILVCGYSYSIHHGEI